LGFSEDDLKRLEDDMAELRFDMQPTDEGGADDAAAAIKLGPDQVTLSLPLTVAERALIFEAIAAAKIQFGMEEGGSALCQICKLHLTIATASKCA
jgi:hypothetical protein